MSEPLGVADGKALFCECADLVSEFRIALLMTNQILGRNEVKGVVKI